jgi:hypothetical protein
MDDARTLTTQSNFKLKNPFRHSPSPVFRSARKIGLILTEKSLPFLYFWIGIVEFSFPLKAKVLITH